MAVNPNNPIDPQKNNQLAAEYEVKMKAELALIAELLALYQTFAADKAALPQEIANLLNNLLFAAWQMVQSSFEWVLNPGAAQELLDQIEQAIDACQNLDPANLPAALLALTNLLQYLNNPDSGTPNSLSSLADLLTTIIGMVVDLGAADAGMAGILGILNLIDPGLASLDNALAALASDEASVAGNGFGEDSDMLASYITKICDAIKDKAQADLIRGKIAADGDNNADALKDAIAAMKASAAEGGVLAGLQAEMSGDETTLNNQKNAAQNDLNSYNWWDDFKAFWSGGDEGAKAADRATIANANMMHDMIQNLMTLIAPEMASAETSIFETASLTLDKIVKELLAVLENNNLTPEQKGTQVKYLLALALGVLSRIQSDAAQEKAKDQQTESESATYAVQMNISNQKAELTQLEQDLSYAHAMGIFMKIAKPLLEVGGALFAPGLGSLAVMVLLAIADEAGLTDKLTSEVAKIPGLGNIGAEVIVGALEVAITVGGGALLDKKLLAKAAAAVVAEVLAKETVETAGKDAIESGTQNALASAGKVGDAAATASAGNVVSTTVNSSMKKAAEKTFIQFSNQPAATLVARLVQTAIKERTTNLAVIMAKACEEDAIVSAKAAAKIASEDISFFAEAAAKGASITEAQMMEVADAAAAKSVATLTGATAKATAERTDWQKAGSRAVWSATYVAFSDGALSSGVEAALKKAGKKEDDKEFVAIMETIKIIESILASFAMMYGSGMLESVVANGSPTTLLKIGTLSNLAGTAAQGASLAGQADAEMKRADAVQAINETSVSNEMMNLYMQQFNSQAQIDEKLLESQMATQASNYRLISQLENDSKAAAEALATQAV